MHGFYRLTAFVTLGQLITSVVEKKDNRNEQNFEVYWKTRMEDGRYGIVNSE